MSVTLLVFCALFIACAVMAFVRPVWGISLYMLANFANPHIWWWGLPLRDFRVSLASGVVLLIVCLLSPHRGESGRLGALQKWIIGIGILLALNALFVHFALSAKMTIFASSAAAGFKEINESPLENYIKFVVLFLTMAAAIRSRADIPFVFMTLLICTNYIGFEVQVNERGGMHGGRLENIGVASARDSNGLASLLTVILPMGGALFLVEKGWRRMLVFLLMPLAVNLFLKCNSRGAMLASGISCFVFLFTSPPQVRKVTFGLLCLGFVGSLLLMRDERIYERFLTIFAKAEERDASASNRLLFWKCGLYMIADHPLGAGGHGFKYGYGPAYLEREGFIGINRAVHNGFINEGCEWGIQGFLLKMSFLLLSALSAIITARRSAQHGDPMTGVLGAAIASGIIAFLGTCMFGDHLDSEQGFWLAALAVGYSRFYSVAPAGLQFEPYPQISQGFAPAPAPVRGGPGVWWVPQQNRGPAQPRWRPREPRRIARQPSAGSDVDDSTHKPNEG